MSELKWFERVAVAWRLWRKGVPEDNHQGVELGTFRMESCPALAASIGQGRFRMSPESQSFVKSVSTPEDVLGIKLPSFKFGPQGESNDIPTPLLIQTANFSTASNSEESSLQDSVVQEEPEKSRFLVRFVNTVLPDTFESESDLDTIAEIFQSGVLPCILLNALMGEMVDIRAVNTSESALSFAERRQNHILCLNSLATVSQRPSSHLKAEDLANGSTEACINLLWRIINLSTIHKIDVHRYPELRQLQEEDEDIFDFLQLSPEDLLLRWVHHLISQSSDFPSMPIGNLADDLSDAQVFLKLQQVILPDLMTEFEGHDSKACAEQVLSNCQAMKMRVSHSVEDLLSGDLHRNCILLSQIFSFDHGLSIPSDGENFDDAFETFTDEGSREERTFRMWMNSLGCTTHCSNLFSVDFRSGWTLLEILESIQPNCIDWSKTNKPPFKSVVSRIKSVENCSQVIKVAKETLHLSLVGIGGDDIADGKRKPILALVWQLLRLHTLMILNSVLESSSSPRALLRADTQSDLKRKFNEADILAWANHMLDISGSHRKIANFRDPQLGNSLALLDLLKAIEPHAVQEKHITPGITSQEQEMNAKYVLSIARKLGSTIFIAWEDIVEVKPKMVLLLIASFLLLDKQVRKMHRAATMNRKDSIHPSNDATNGLI